MPVTDEDVTQRQEEILALRAERDQAKTEAETAFKSRDNEISMAAMDAEEDKLRAEIEFYQNQTEGADKAVEAQKEAVVAGISGNPSASEPTGVTSVDLDSMTKPELQEYANSAGITVSSGLSKDDMLAAIRAGRE